MEPVALTLSPWEPDILALAVYTALVVVALAAVLFLTARLGQGRPNPEKREPYESGMIPSGPMRMPHPVPFFLMAAFFLVFDVEAAFVFSWAVDYVTLGWAGFVRIGIFILVLLASLYYIWAKGGLEWGPSTLAR